MWAAQNDRRPLSGPSVLVRIDHVPTGHRDAERAKRVLHAYRVAVCGEYLRQTLVDLRRLVGPAPDEHDSLSAQAGLHCGPVDEAGLDLLLDPHLLQARVGVVGAHAGLRHAGGRADAVDVEHATAVACGARIALAPPDAPRRLRPAHHAARPVDGRVERVARVGALDALEDHGVVAHRAAHEPLLSRSGGRAALANNPVRAAERLLPP